MPLTHDVVSTARNTYLEQQPQVNETCFLPLFTRVRGRGGLRSLNPEGRMGGFLETPEGEPRESPVRFLGSLSPYETPRRPLGGNLAALRGCQGVYSLSALKLVT